jgi:hypothetical protein
MRITYIGKRMTSKLKLLEFYLDTESNEKLIFKKKLEVTHSLGAVLEVERTDDGVKGPFKNVGRHSIDSDITMWSTQQAEAIEHNRQLKEDREQSDAHIDSLIAAVKANTYTPAERKRVLSYIIQKLL